MLTEEILLSLDKVKSNGSNKWLACCPAHQDKSPSMSILDTGDKLYLNAGLDALLIILWRHLG